MARTIPGSYTAVDPQALLTGEALKASTVTPLGSAVNYLMSQVARCTVISQSWAQTGGASVCRRTAGTLAECGKWEIPQLAGATAVTVTLIARVAAGPVTTHAVEIRSATGAATLTIDAADGLSTSLAVYSGSLAVGFAGGYENITMHLLGDGATPVEVVALLVRYPVLSSLAAGRLSDGRIAVDDDDIEPDNPLSARLGHDLRGCMAGLAALPRVHANVSDLRNVDTASQNELAPYRHSFPGPRLPDVDDRALDLTVRIRTTSAADGRIVLRHSGDGERGPVTEVQVGAGAARSMSTATIRQRPGQGIAPASLGIDWQAVGIVPQHDPAFVDRLQTDTSTVDQVHGVLVWGWT